MCVGLGNIAMFNVFFVCETSLLEIPLMRVIVSISAVAQKLQGNKIGGTLHISRMVVVGEIDCNFASGGQD